MIERKVRHKKVEVNLPTEFSPDSLRSFILAYKPAGKLYQIWYASEMTTVLPETREKRRQELSDWEEGLTPDQQQIFNKNVTTVIIDGRDEEVGLGYLIRRLAQDDVRREKSIAASREIEEKRKEREEKQRKEKVRKAKSVRLYTRRIKAQDRRDTNPKNIH